MVHWITEQRCHTLFEQFAGMLRDKEQKGEEQARSRLEECPERARSALCMVGAASTLCVSVSFTRRLNGRSS
jgi:hypothetical protein